MTAEQIYNLLEIMSLSVVAVIVALVMLHFCSLKKSASDVSNANVLRNIVQILSNNSLNN